MVIGTRGTPVRRDDGLGAGSATHGGHHSELCRVQFERSDHLRRRGRANCLYLVKGAGLADARPPSPLASARRPTGCGLNRSPCPYVLPGVLVISRAIKLSAPGVMPGPPSSKDRRFRNARRTARPTCTTITSSPARSTPNTAPAGPASSPWTSPSPRTARVSSPSPTSRTLLDPEETLSCHGHDPRKLPRGDGRLSAPVEGHTRRQALVPPCNRHATRNRDPLGRRAIVVIVLDSSQVQTSPYAPNGT